MPTLEWGKDQKGSDLQKHRMSANAAHLDVMARGTWVVSIILLLILFIKPCFWTTINWVYFFVFFTLMVQQTDVLVDKSQCILSSQFHLWYYHIWTINCTIYSKITTNSLPACFLSLTLKSQMCSLTLEKYPNFFVLVHICSKHLVSDPWGQKKIKQETK